MKRLVIIRHAKTEQQGYERDFERELVQRGIENAKVIAEGLKNREIYPGKIISSPAQRAITTARIFADILNFQSDKIVENKGLYFDFTTQDLLDLISETEENIDIGYSWLYRP